MMDSQRASSSISRWPLLLLLGLALSLRLWNFPKPGECRDPDEGGYVQSGLGLAEGMTPTFKASPSGPQTWIGWTWVMGRTAWYMITEPAEEATASTEMLPYVALNHALWETYYNTWPLWRFEVGVSAALSVLAVWPAYRLGGQFGGQAGAIFCGGLFAALPVFVELSDQARPYAMAWSFGVMALWAAVRGAPKGRVWFAAILMAVAVASRIEMLCLVPLAAGEYWLASAPEQKSRLIAAYLSLTFLIFAACAPWFFTNILGNLKTIVGVRLLSGSFHRQSTAGILLETLIYQPMILPAIGLLVALLAPARLISGRRPMIALVVLLLLTILWPTDYGVRHQGQVLVAVAVYGTIGIGILAERARATTQALAVLTVVAATALTARAIPRNRVEVLDPKVVEWVQQNIPAGTRIYWSAEIPGILLPTAEAANRVWEDLASPKGFESEFNWRMQQLGLLNQEPPRACAIDWMVKEQGLQRGLYILGGRGNVGIPRYDLFHWMIHSNETFVMPTDREWLLARPSADVNGREPTACWVHNGTVRAAVYCSPGLENSLRKDAPRGRIEF
jgi:hypothetical protein